MKNESCSFDAAAASVVSSCGIASNGHTGVCSRLFMMHNILVWYVISEAMSIVV
jgi:hypothetical protein